MMHSGRLLDAVILDSSHFCAYSSNGVIYFFNTELTLLFSQGATDNRDMIPGPAPLLRSNMAGLFGFLKKDNHLAIYKWETPESSGISPKKRA